MKKNIYIMKILKINKKYQKKNKIIHQFGHLKLRFSYKIFPWDTELSYL